MNMCWLSQTQPTHFLRPMIGTQMNIFSRRTIVAVRAKTDWGKQFISMLKICKTMGRAHYSLKTKARKAIATVCAMRGLRSEWDENQQRSTAMYISYGLWMITVDFFVSLGFVYQQQQKKSPLVFCCGDERTLKAVTQNAHYDTYSNNYWWWRLWNWRSQTPNEIYIYIYGSWSSLLRSGLSICPTMSTVWWVSVCTRFCILLFGGHHISWVNRPNREACEYILCTSTHLIQCAVREKQ